MDATELGFIQDGFNSITIGRSDGTGLITVNALAWNDLLILRSDDITIAGAQTMGANDATFNIGQTSAGTLNLNASVTTTGAFALNGGAGNDNFIFADGVALPTAVNGNAGTDTLNFSADTGGVSIALATLTSIESIIGGSGNDTLTGANSANTWNLTADNAGNVGGGLTFSSIENLTGGSSTDAFVFSNGVTMSGAINGNGGTDTLNYSAYATAVAVNLQTGSATGITGGLSNMETLIGGSAATTLTLDNGGNAVTLTGSNAGNVGGAFTFSQVDVLAGGSGADSLTFSGANDAISLTGANAGTANSNLTFSSFETLDAGAGSDTLIGRNIANTWNITANNGGVLGTLTFANVEVLTGGSSTDEFVFSDGVGVSGIVDGGAGMDGLDYSAYTTDVTVNFETGTATGTGGILNIENFTGGAGNDTVSTRFFAYAQTLNGNGGADTLNFNAQNRIAESTASPLSASGYGDVGFTSLETVNFSNPLAVSSANDSTSEVINSVTETLSSGGSLTETQKVEMVERFEMVKERVNAKPLELMPSNEPVKIVYEGRKSSNNIVEFSGFELMVEEPDPVTVFSSQGRVSLRPSASSDSSQPASSPVADDAPQGLQEGSTSANNHPRNRKRSNYSFE